MKSFKNLYDGKAGYIYTEYPSVKDALIDRHYCKCEDQILIKITNEDRVSRRYFKVWCPDLKKAYRVIDIYQYNLYEKRSQSIMGGW